MKQKDKSYAGFNLDGRINKQVKTNKKYIQTHTTLYHITRLHVSTHYPSDNQVAAHPEVGMFTTAKARLILFYTKNDTHILLYKCMFEVHTGL
jgi:hypothetical protein